MDLAARTEEQRLATRQRARAQEPARPRHQRLCDRDPLGNYREMYPGMRTCRAWDRADGDAQLLAGVSDESLDFVHSSHCLEHMVDPRIALDHWIRVLKPGGHLVIVVPDEDLYEQGVFPSTFNTDHKWTFTIAKLASWSPRSVNVTDLLNGVSDRVQPIKFELLDASYRWSGIPRFDQTLGRRQARRRA